MNSQVIVTVSIPFPVSVGLCVILDGRCPEPGIGDERPGGEAVKKLNKVGLAAGVQFEPPDELALARTVAAVACEGTVRDEPAPPGVMLDHLGERRDAAVVHV